jgi:dUTP pyrophosphatase
MQKGVTVLNAPGLIDSGYRGELKVLLINHGAETVVIERGERIAQLVVQAVPRVRLRESDVLPGSARGGGGFGSTGA